MKITEIIEGVFDTVKSTDKRHRVNLEVLIRRYEEAHEVVQNLINDMFQLQDKHPEDVGSYWGNPEDDKENRVYPLIGSLGIRKNSEAEREAEPLYKKVELHHKKVVRIETHIKRLDPDYFKDDEILPSSLSAVAESYRQTIQAKAEKQFGKSFANEIYARYQKLKSKKNRTKKDEERLYIYELQLKDIRLDKR